MRQLAPDELVCNIRSRFPTPCTDLSEIDLVLGGEARLYRGIIDLYNRLKPALIEIIPTCHSDMTSDDLNVIMSLWGQDLCEIAKGLDVCTKIV